MSSFANAGNRVSANNDERRRTRAGNSAEHQASRPPCLRGVRRSRRVHQTTTTQHSGDRAAEQPDAVSRLRSRGESLIYPVTGSTAPARSNRPVAPRVNAWYRARENAGREHRAGSDGLDGTGHRKPGVRPGK